ncbi:MULTISPECIES: xanthine dehydrogenase family protein molybdopterin-binding subunit [unclassified Gordonia (in: high G+C Gram-positive bacteria)]|uniref:xanthine dehydrogenase family protein molybdopterin-binding subunit n=1 Tax=Gordonia TaxID=2053 RepID=UPI0006E2DA76|nr:MULTISPECIES: xanthine dehydrogenase family protein molybdopterin-binding subunit [unclassified Gordonia (in: high G+C Gram-positive bacteria)]MBN0971310.1 xanthine dehydrogenase family protein molybdopterin-binding subunit [Gordonia sp. BP-119]MBN0983629.1 xanthine dehydrogenase family protein molybdopterin-binding subunit [Gordonia sp. BP-94]WGJ87147.1 xanthine dehydrogenase family protein molybdopterin-binding subunit [Gordonia sp. SMJS1]
MTAIGTSHARIDGADKVRGTAPYAYEHLTEAAYLWPITATIARGRIAGFDTAAAESTPGVLYVLTPENAPELADTSSGDLTILQSPEIAYRGQLIGAVVAESPETAREAASAVTVTYDEDAHDTEFRVDHPDSYRPEQVNGGFEPTSQDGDPDRILDEAASTTGGDTVTVDQWYSTPEEHNNPMEPHTVVATWDADAAVLTLYDSTQSTQGVVSSLAPVLGLEPEQMRVMAPHVGGGFGSKGSPHSHDVLAAMAAMRLPGRPVKFAVTRQHMFVFVGHRAPTRSRLRLAADRDGHITAMVHEAFTHSAHAGEFAEQAAVTSRSMYSADHRRTDHHVVPLDVPVPFWMRAPGEAPGMFAGEVAMDELAHALDLDPIELRVRNEPPEDPETGNPWSSRRLLDCFREGARRFGWERRVAEPAARRNGRQLVGLGVASSTYPHMVQPGNAASITHRDGRYTVRIAATDIGTGAWTTLKIIAADALDVPTDVVDIEIGDSALPSATVAGGSSGTSSWGSAIVTAAHQFRARFGDDPPPDAELSAEAADNPDLEKFTVASFGAHFVEVGVDIDTGEIRIPRMLGVFSIGRAINPRTVRSQLIGGMTFGISMALHEESVRDHRFGHVVTQDLAEYHIPVHADIADVDAICLDDRDEHATPMGSRGAGEIGIVGSAAAVVNAIYNATGVRVRDLPAHLDDLLGGLPYQ